MGKVKTIKVGQSQTLTVSESRRVANITRAADAAENYMEKGFDVTLDGDPEINNAMWDSEVKAFIDAQTLKSLFFSEDWVFIVVDLCASKISSQPLLVMKTTAQAGGVSTVEYDDAHPLNQLIENPNDFQDYHSWMYNTIVEFFLIGNAIIWNARAKGQLTTLPSDMISLDFDAAGGLRNYLLSMGRSDAKTQFDKAGTITFSPDEIIHARRPNPSSLLWGLSPFIPGRKSVLFNRYSSDYLNAFYIKQATPAMALTMDRQVSEDVALRQLRSFELLYSGRKNTRRTMIIPKGMDIKPLSHTLADQKLVDTIDKNRETIINLLKVPKHELSLQASGSLGSEEYRIALRNFWASTLKPAMRMIEGSLTKHFAAELGPDRFLQFDLTDVEALKDDELSKASHAKALLEAGWTINEVRQELYEKEKSTEAHASIPFILVPKQTAGFGGGITPGSTPSVPAPTAPVAPHDTAPPPPAEPPPPKQIEAAPVQAMDTKPRGDVDAVARHLAKHTSWLAATVKNFNDTLGKEGDTIFKLAVDTLIGMAEKGLAEIKRSLKALVYDVKADDAPPEDPASIPSRAILQKRILLAMQELEDEWIKTYADTLEASVELGYDTQIDFVFGDDNVSAIEALRSKGTAQRRAILEARGLKAFADISATHSERIMKAVTDGVDAGKSVGEIADTISQTFLDPKEMLGRSQTIARTETLTAVSLGQNAAVQNAKEVLPGLKKAWLNAGDEDVRDSHREVSKDGAIGVDEKFSNGLMFPRDTDGAPEETINCRCTLVMIPEGE